MRRRTPGGPSLPPRRLSRPITFSSGERYPWAFVRLDFQGPHVQLATVWEPGSPRAPACRSEKAGAGRWLVGRLVAPPVGSQHGRLCAASPSPIRRHVGRTGRPGDRPPGSQPGCLSSRKPSWIAPAPNRQALWWSEQRPCLIPPAPLHRCSVFTHHHPITLRLHESRNCLVFPFGSLPACLLAALN